jgi:DNA processing protein
MIEHLVALNALPKIGPVRIRRLLDTIGDAEAVLSAPKDRLTRVKGIGPETAEILRRWQDHVDPAAELREVAERGLSVLTPADECFPPALREAYDAPILLYVWGRLETRDRHAIGVVGTRRASIYGKNSSKRLAFQLADAGYTILSGLARGIDTSAHEAALAARDGRTVAVIGSGLAQVFPAENLGLAEKIAAGRGAVISEFPLHTKPDKQTFPQRNRIVAAWSQALLVTESPAWSGSLITANLAAEYGRPVFAVPGPIDRPTSAGCHRLIRDGATLVTDGADILDDLGALPFANKPQARTPDSPPSTPELPADEQKILNALGTDECGVDALIEATDLPAAAVSACLLKLEMKSLVRALPGFRYTRR